MKMSVKEQALRFALDFFKDEDMWERKADDGRGLRGALCVGLALIKGRGMARRGRRTLEWDNKWLNEVMQMEYNGGAEVAGWNDHTCPDIAALRDRLECRIAHYEQERLTQTHIAVIILGPGRNLRRM